MKLGKLINGTITLIDVENGKEIDGPRTDKQLYDEGYKKACPYMGEEQGVRIWNDYPQCLVEELISQETAEPNPYEITDTEALEIITGQNE